MPAFGIIEVQGTHAYPGLHLCVVREQGEKQFDRFRTRDLVLGYMNTIAAGDLGTRIDA